MLKELEVSNLGQIYYLIQKNIGSNWTDRGRFETEEDAIVKINELIKDDIEKNNKFIYRLIKINEIKLYKSLEKKPDDMLGPETRS